MAPLNYLQYLKLNIKCSNLLVHSFFISPPLIVSPVRPEHSVYDSFITHNTHLNMDVGEEEAERVNTEDVYDDRDDILEKEELAGKDNKALTEALLVPVMMIFLRTGSTVEICVIMVIVCFIVAIILRSFR